MRSSLLRSGVSRIRPILLGSALLACGSTAMAQSLDLSQGPAGGGSGSGFSRRVPAGMRIDRVELRTGADIDNLRFYATDLFGTSSWDSGWLGSGFGGGLQTFTVPAGATLDRVRFWHNGDLLRGVELSAGPRTQLFGNAVGTVVSYSAPLVANAYYEARHAISGFHGRSNERIRALGILTREFDAAEQLLQRNSGTGASFQIPARPAEYIQEVEVEVYAGIVVRLRTYLASPNGGSTVSDWSGPFINFQPQVHRFRIASDDHLKKIRVSYSLYTTEFAEGLTLETARGQVQHYGLSPNSIEKWDQVEAPPGHEIVGFFGQNTGYGRYGNAGLGILSREISARRLSIGSGCGTSAFGPPILQASSRPTMGTTLAVTIARVQAGLPTALMLCDRSAALPLGACTLYLADPLFVGSVPANSGGSAAYSFPLPSSLYFLDLTVYFQGIVLRSGGPLLGAADLSPGLQLTLGMR